MESEYLVAAATAQRQPTAAQTIAVAVNVTVPGGGERVKGAAVHQGTKTRTLGLWHSMAVVQIQAMDFGFFEQLQPRW